MDKESDQVQIQQAHPWTKLLINHLL